MLFWNQFDDRVNRMSDNCVTVHVPTLCIVNQIHLYLSSMPTGEYITSFGHLLQNSSSQIVHIAIFIFSLRLRVHVYTNLFLRQH